MHESEWLTVGEAEIESVRVYVRARMFNEGVSGVFPPSPPSSGVLHFSCSSRGFFQTWVSGSNFTCHRRRRRRRRRHRHRRLKLSQSANLH